MVPKLKLGIAVLTNQESGAAFESLTYLILDQFLKAPYTDWVAAYKRVNARNDSLHAATDQKNASRTDSTATPPLPLERYVGTYTDPWYGDMEISLRDGKLRIRMVPTPALQGDLEYWQYGSFVARWSDPELRADAFVTFALSPDGRIEKTTMKAFSSETDFSFDFQDLTFKPGKK